MEEKIIELVNSRADKIDCLNGKKVLSVSVGEVKKQNSLSNRSGSPILIKYLDNEVVCTEYIWAKFLESPQESYHAQERAYSHAEKHGISAPIPKPYFFDTNNNVVFMEMKTGINVLELTLRYGFSLNLFPNDDLRKLFFEIGFWLQRFHASVEIEETTNLKTIIEKVNSELKSTVSFSQLEKNSLSDALKRFYNKPVAKQEFPLVTPHNDFTLRNLFMQHAGGFNIVDWDAMVHPCFPQKALCWWDLTILIINMQSMLKLEPIIKISRIKTLCNAVIEGYFSENATVSNIGADEFLQCIYYVYTLKYWLGIDSDRPLWKVYGASRGMGNRYVARLRRMLLAGKADICGG